MGERGAGTQVSLTHPCSGLSRLKEADTTEVIKQQLTLNRPGAAATMAIPVDIEALRAEKEKERVGRGWFNMVGGLAD